MQCRITQLDWQYLQSKRQSGRGDPVELDQD